MRNSAGYQLARSTEEELVCRSKYSLNRHNCVHRGGKRLTWNVNCSRVNLSTLEWLIDIRGSRRHRCIVEESLELPYYFRQFLAVQLWDNILRKEARSFGFDVSTVSSLGKQLSAKARGVVIIADFPKHPSDYTRAIGSSAVWPDNIQ